MIRAVVEFAHRIYGDQRRRWMGFMTRKVLGPHVFGILVNANGGRFVIDPADAEIGLQVRSTGRFGDAEINRLLPYIRPESKVLVVGAHIGLLAIPLARHCAEVVAIEANPRTFGFLEMNARINGVPNIRLCQFAASDQPGKLEFLMSTANSGGSKRVPKVRQSMYYYDNPAKIEVQATVLDDELDGECFDVIVMDIEGSEYFALGGMQRLLSSCQALSIEFLPHHLRNVAGVSVGQLMERVTPHFDHLKIPSNNIAVPISEAAAVLNRMFDLDQGDEALLFEKLC